MAASLWRCGAAVGCAVRGGGLRGRVLATETHGSGATAAGVAFVASSFAVWASTSRASCAGHERGEGVAGGTSRVACSSAASAPASVADHFSHRRFMDRVRRYAAAAHAGGAPLRIILFGAPGSGKGTQAELLVDTFGFVHVATGDMFRQAIRDGSPLGLEAKRYMDAGELVPPRIGHDMLRARLARADVLAKGYVLDGFPRERRNAEFLVEIGELPHAILLLEVPDAELVKRLAGRRRDPVTGKTWHVDFKPPPREVEHRLVTRPDDAPDVARVRVASYNARVEDCLAPFDRAVIFRVDGVGTPADVFDRLRAIVDKLRATS